MSINNTLSCVAQCKVVIFDSGRTELTYSFQTKYLSRLSKNIWLYDQSDIPVTCSDAALTLWHPLVSCWRCVNRAWIIWELSLTTPTSTCSTWCTRPWGFVSTWRTQREPSVMARRLSNLTGTKTRWNLKIMFYSWSRSETIDRSSTNE